MNEALAAAIHLLERRPLFEEQLRVKLSAYADEDVEAAIAELSQRRILDDRRLALDFVAEHRGKNILSADALRAKLEAKGLTFIPIEIPEPTGEEVQSALESRHFRINGDAHERARASRWLGSRGFDAETVELAADRYFAQLD